MKKILQSIILFAAIMLGTMTAAKAQTPVTFYVHITITDTTCLPHNYNGYYCVRLNLLYDGNVLCTAQNCYVTQTPSCYAFTCYLIDKVAVDCKYGIQLVGAYRTPSGLCQASTFPSQNGVCWGDLEDNQNCPVSLSITL